MQAPPPIPPTLPYGHQEPVKGKAHGLVPVTRKTYVMLQTAVFIVGLALAAWFYFAPPRVVVRTNWLLPLLLIALLLEAVETAFMLRRFAQKERERA